MIRKIEHYTDFILTQEFARKRLEENSIAVTWFTNHENTRSIVHSHPYYEAVLSISGSDVAYSADGDLYQLKQGGNHPVSKRAVPCRKIRLQLPVFRTDCDSD